MQNQSVAYAPKVIGWVEMITKRLAEKYGDVKVRVTAGFHNINIRHWFTQQDPDAALDSGHATAVRLADGSTVEVSDSLDLIFIYEKEGKNGLVPLQDVYAVANTVAGSQGEIGLYDDGHTHIGLNKCVSKEGKPGRWQRGVNIIPPAELYDPHHYPLSLQDLLTPEIMEALLAATRYYETEIGGFGWQDLKEYVARKLGVAKTRGDYELSFATAKAYLKAQQKKLRLSDAQVNNSKLQQEYLDTPLLAKKVADWWYRQLLRDFDDFFRAMIGQEVIPLDAEQAIVLVGSNYRGKRLAIEQALLGYAVHRAAILEDIIPDQSDGRLTESNLRALAKKYGAAPESGFNTTRTRAVLESKEVFTITYEGRGAPLNVAKPGQDTLAGYMVNSLGSKNKEELPKGVYISGRDFRPGEELRLLKNGRGGFEYYRRNATGFFKSRLGKKIIARIGGLQQVIPLYETVLKKDPGFLNVLNRGANIAARINRANPILLRKAVIPDFAGFLAVNTLTVPAAPAQAPVAEPGAPAEPAAKLAQIDTQVTALTQRIAAREARVQGMQAKSQALAREIERLQQSQAQQSPTMTNGPPQATLRGQPLPEGTREEAVPTQAAPQPQSQTPAVAIPQAAETQQLQEQAQALQSQIAAKTQALTQIEQSEERIQTKLQLVQIQPAAAAVAAPLQFEPVTLSAAQTNAPALDMTNAPAKAAQTNKVSAVEKQKGVEAEVTALDANRNQVTFKLGQMVYNVNALNGKVIAGIISAINSKGFVKAGGLVVAFERLYVIPVEAEQRAQQLIGSFVKQFTAPDASGKPVAFKAGQTVYDLNRVSGEIIPYTIKAINPKERNIVDAEDRVSLLKYVYLNRAEADQAAKRIKSAISATAGAPAATPAPAVVNVAPMAPRSNTTAISTSPAPQVTLAQSNVSAKTTVIPAPTNPPARGAQTAARTQDLAKDSSRLGQNYSSNAVTSAVPGLAAFASQLTVLVQSQPQQPRVAQTPQDKLTKGTPSTAAIVNTDQGFVPVI